MSALMEGFKDGTPSFPPGTKRLLMGLTNSSLFTTFPIDILSENHHLSRSSFCVNCLEILLAAISLTVGFLIISWASLAQLWWGGMDHLQSLLVCDGVSLHNNLLQNQAAHPCIIFLIEENHGTLNHLWGKPWAMLPQVSNFNFQVGKLALVPW